MARSTRSAARKLPPTSASKSKNGSKNGSKRGNPSSAKSKSPASKAAAKTKSLFHYFSPSPSKKSKAAANTKPLFHYFSPSPSKTSKKLKNTEGSPTKGGNRVDDRERATKTNEDDEIEIVKVIRSPTATTPPKHAVDGNHSPPLNTTQLKRKSPSPLCHLNPNLIKGQKDTCAEDSSAKKSKSGTGECLFGVREKKGSQVSGPTKLSATVTSNRSSRNASKLDNVEQMEICNRNTSTKQNKAILDVKSTQSRTMALIPIRNATTNLEELCHTLQIDPTETDVYNLRAKSILGRDEPKVKKNKISIGISTLESGVSRKQILVNCINQKQTTDSAQVNIQCDKDSSESHLCNYLKDMQDRSSTVTVCNKGKNAVLVCKARVGKDVMGRDCLKGHISRLDEGCSILLKVGDALVFDAYKYKKSASSEVQAVTIQGCKFVYRLVSVSEGLDAKSRSSNNMLEQKLELKCTNTSAVKNQSFEIYDDDIKGSRLDKSFKEEKNSTQTEETSNSDAQEICKTVDVNIEKETPARKKNKSSAKDEPKSFEPVQKAEIIKDNDETRSSEGDMETPQPLQMLNRRVTRRMIRAQTSDSPPVAIIKSFPDESPIKHGDDDTSPDSICNPYIAVFDDNQSEDDVSMNLDLSQDSFLNFSLKCDPTTANGPLIQEMNPTLGNSTWRALNSVEAQNGFGILAHLESSWNIIPNENLSESFTDFLLHGPKKEHTKILEPHRTELAFEYMNRILTKAELGREKHRIGLRPDTNPETFLEMPMAEAESFSVSAASEAQNFRLSQTLQFCSNSLDFVVKSITMEMESIISGGTQPTAKLLSNMKVASFFLRNDIRHSLKMVARCAVKFLLRQGKWLIGLPGQEVVLCKTPYEQNCAKYTRNCVTSYGIILSHVAWLFCASENIPFADPSCCFLIKDVINAEFADIDFSRMSKKKVSMKNRETYSRDMKIRLLFSVETKFSARLQSQLASHLDLAREAALIL